MQASSLYLYLLASSNATKAPSMSNDHHKTLGPSNCSIQELGIRKESKINSALPSRGEGTYGWNENGSKLFS
jgi:hypothetical protein